MSDFSWMLQLVAPVAALAGVVIGVLSSRSLGQQTARIQWNSAQIETTREFHVEAVAAAHDLSILYQRLIQDIDAFMREARNRVESGEILTSEETYYRYSDDLVARITRATDAWRRVIARRIVHADAQVSKAIENLDRIREEATVAINTADVPSAAVAAKAFEANLPLLYRAIRRNSLEANLVLSEHLTPGLYRTRQRKQILSDIAELDGLVT
ncbi:MULTISPECIES: hypothetical protein [unclassified Pseudarthrobacter]|uniref:hypothetical protein n=1 Tax=unclassified Pseudarthrobacter TaxID=2647000 RepID=UPI00363E9DD7